MLHCHLMTSFSCAETAPCWKPVVYFASTPAWLQREGPYGLRGQGNGRIGFVSLTDSIDTTSASGRLIDFASAWLFFRQPRHCLIH
jgi:hypothetical protein